jgi:hypothetical protein
MTTPLGRIEMLISALRPVLGNQVDAYKQLWLLEDRHGREEIEQLLEWEYAQQFTTPNQPVLPPPPHDSLPSDGIEVGEILYQDKAVEKLVIAPHSLLRHVLIAGSTGSGKTTLVYQFCKELLRLKIPFFIFDWKLDYRPLTQLDAAVQVYTVGSTVRPLHFNPLLELSRFIVRNDRARDLSPLFQMSDILCRVFHAGHGVGSVLNKCFGALFRQWVDHEYASEYEPSFRRALAWVREHEPTTEKGMRFREWKVSTLRILEMLSMGSFGDAICASSAEHVRLDDLFGQRVVFELNLPEDFKAFFVESFLLCTRLSGLEALKERPRGQLQGIMLIDEAHNLVRKHDPTDRTESQLQMALRENRGLGWAYLIADQTPSQLDDTALANTHYKFFFTLDQADDIRVASKSLLLSPEQRTYLAKLPVGHCLCRFGNNDAFLVRSYPADDVKNAIITDDNIRASARTARSIPELVDEFTQAVGDLASTLQELDPSESGREAAESTTEQPIEAKSGAKQPPRAPDKEVVLTSIEQGLLDDILKEPFAGINAHFKNLGVSTANGRKARASLEQKGLLETKAIGLGDRGGQLLLATLTADGAALLREQGKDARWPYFQNGGEHEYWKDRVARHFMKLGYKVTKEVGINGYADVTATKGDERVAIEVETGKSDVQANLTKYQGKDYTKVILLATQASVAQRLEVLRQHGYLSIPVEVWTTRDLVNVS